MAIEFSVESDEAIEYDAALTQRHLAMVRAEGYRSSISRTMSARRR